MANLYDVLSELCEKAGITGYKMSVDLGLSKNLMTELKMGRKKGVNAETAEKIANYFDVSVSYLLGKEEQKEKPTANDGSKLSIDERVEQILDGMANERSGSLMLDGKPASPEAVEALRQAIKMGVEYARKINSEKK